MRVVSSGLGGSRTQEYISRGGAARFAMGGGVVTAAAQQGASQCVSAHKSDTPTAQCQAFCSEKFRKFHCGWCKCRLCDFCPKGGEAIEEAAKDEPPPSPLAPPPSSPPLAQRTFDSVKPSIQADSGANGTLAMPGAEASTTESGVNASTEMTGSAPMSAERDPGPLGSAVNGNATAVQHFSTAPAALVTVVTTNATATPLLLPPLSPFANASVITMASSFYTRTIMAATASTAETADLAKALQGQNEAEESYEESEQAEGTTKAAEAEPQDDVDGQVMEPEKPEAEVPGAAA